MILSPENKAKWLIITLTLTFFLGMGKLANKLFFSSVENALHCQDEEEIIYSPAKEYFYGFDLDSFSVIEGKIKSGQSFSDLLTAQGVNYATILALDKDRTTSFDARKIIADKPYAFLVNKNDSAPPVYFFYFADRIHFYVLRLDEQPEIAMHSKEVELKRKEVMGEISSSLYQAFESRNLSISLAMELADIFAWTIDFYRIQKGDKFKVIYYEKLVDGKFAGIEKIEAAYFEHYKKPYYAFRYEDKGKVSYYDENGQSVRKLFLKAPLKFSRISSKYNLKRFHPVLKTTKAHLGTDYAAPTGTPVMSVGDGVVVEAGRTSGNGNYVKIKHNSVYTTQYLHLSKFQKGIQKGARVHQGDVIGYVGSTGLATGPHLCFRFWKNGKQVNPLNEKPMQSEPIKPNDKLVFDKMVDTVKPLIDKI